MSFITPRQNDMNIIISDIGRILESMANGDFNVDTERNREVYEGDYEKLYNSVVNINSKLSDTLWSINVAADQVSSGSDQVSAGAQALSQGATEQASSIEELSSSIMSVSEQVQTIRFPVSGSQTGWNAPRLRSHLLRHPCNNGTMPADLPA